MTKGFDFQAARNARHKHRLSPKGIYFQVVVISKSDVIKLKEKKRINSPKFLSENRERHFHPKLQLRLLFKIPAKYEAPGFFSRKYPDTVKSRSSDPTNLKVSH